MSLSSKLLVYAYYGAYTLPHERYGESYHLYRMVHEYLSEDYKGNVSCVRRDVATARCLNSGNLCFEAARQLLDVSEVAARLSAWYCSGDAAGLCGDVQRALAVIDRRVPLEKRRANGANIFALDAIADTPSEAVDSLQVVIGRFMHFARRNALERVADVFDPKVKADGWWYYKFCVLTYMQRIMAGAVAADLAPRLRAAVQKFIRPDDDQGNDQETIAKVYGRFCGVGREHFVHHKTACMYILFRCMRGDATPADKRHPSFAVIKDFVRQCEGTYADLRFQADTLYVQATSDRQKNALFDLLCCVNAAELDADCYDYIIKKFYNKLNEM